MKKKQIIRSMGLVFLFLVRLVPSQAQSEELFKNFDNSSISYRVWAISPVIVDSGVSQGPKNVIHTNFRGPFRNLINQISKDEWLLLLRNPNTDWATNLVLYEITEEDAIKFEIIKSREDWVRTYRSSDITFWEEKLSTKGGLIQRYPRSR